MSTTMSDTHPSTPLKAIAEDPPPFMHSSHDKRQRSNSSVSHVDVGFFDPAGVRELRRTMSLQRQEEQHEMQEVASMVSDATLRISDDGAFDFEKTLRHVLRKYEEHDIKHRTLGVVFQNLHVTGLGTSDSFQPTLGSALNPLTIFETVQKRRHPTVRDILVGFEGVVKPGEMLLVLGRPGSGCTTLLKTLANHRSEYHAVNGAVHYDSLTPHDLATHFRGDVQYCPEDDIHFPRLTVEQTLKFAVATRTPAKRFAGFSREDFVDYATNVLATIFGLKEVMGTPVGDAQVRGVSGGQRKRVSIAESLAARSCIGAWDNSTRGLDSSTALEFVRALRLATDAFEQTAIVSIYQAGEALYHHFDKVCVIYEGRMAYFGPANLARQYFIDMGYEPAHRQTTADFLVAVTDPTARIAREGYTKQPRTAEEFAEYFLKSDVAQKNKAEIQAYLAEHVDQPEKKEAYVESARAEFAQLTYAKSPYLLNIPQQVKAVMSRRVHILMGNSLTTGLTLFSFVFQAIIMGTLFLQLPEATSAYFSRGGALYFVLLFSALSAMAEIPSLYAQRPIVLRHQKAALYHPFVESLALTLVDFPITLVTILIFGSIFYWMAGLQSGVDQFFVLLLFVFGMALVMKAWFRAIAAAFQSEAAAQTMAGVSILALAIYTGYTIPKPTMVGALRWITYINPLKYGFEAIMTNEFRTLNGLCSNLVPQGPGYENVTLENQVCTTVGSLPGEPDVNGSRFLALAFEFYWSNTWKNLGLVFVFGLAFLIALFLFAEFNTGLATDTSTVRFKRGTKLKYIARSKAGDEEKGGTVVDANASHEKTKPARAVERASYTTEGAPTMTDVFSWQHINYVVPVPGKTDRQLLEDVSGYVAPGKLTALMGESGAGKTTLLNVLAMRTDIGVVTGERFVNGQVLPVDFQSQTGYVQQMDTHVPFNTVREALLFSAKLCQPPSVPLEEKEAYVEKCLEMCGLVDYADATVGSLSIEHRKRTTIGVELAAKPKLLLFLDEPTSGLDSQSAWAIISFLRTLADSGQAILCTIHQPSAELFQVFDRMLLLRKGGQTVYFGDLGHHATTLINYFQKNGARTCGAEENPAEYMLDVIGAGATATSEQDWYAIWKSSPEAKAGLEEIEAIHAEGRNRPAVEATFHSEFATSWVYQAWELFKRDAEAHWRDPTYLIAKLVLSGVGGFFIGLTFFKSKDSQQGTQNKLFAIFMATLLCVPLANQIQVPFINMRKIYEIRERSSRMYSWTALVISQILIEIPWNILASSLLFVSWYWTIGFPNSRAGYSYLMMAIIFPCYYTTFGQAVAAMASTAEIAAVLFSFFYALVLTFNGVIQPYVHLGWWKWMYRVSPFTYLIEGLLGQAIGHQEVNCSPVEFVSINPPAGLTCQQYMAAYMSFAGGYLTNPDASSACQFCSIRTTDQFLELGFNIRYENRWRNLGILVGFSVFNTILIFTLTYIFRIRQGNLLPSFFKKN
ncbi:unnamed protein product [Cyclocybe aegerita]|uniref:ABC transporter domain-containing protein n=1 Tax=Cyclocybe aegerita TaxID=1973307 RepID=A0A8S0W4G4_CYCAE|nr:unnamed protein product [Cyclocybe aegerita]